MTETNTTSQGAGPPVEPDEETNERNPLNHLWVFLVAIGLLLLIFGWQFIRDPSLTAPTRDPAWYTWRSGIIVHANPGLVPADWGPFHMFGGGYRVSVPVIGALLANIAGTAQSSFAAVMMIFVPILAGLAFGAAAYRSTKSAWLYLLTMAVTGLFYLTTPYVGYLDNLFVLFVLAGVIAFLEPARDHWGARTAVFLLSALAFFTHPTTCAVFLGSMIAMMLFHIVSMRFDFRKVLARDLPALAAVFLGMVIHIPLWLAGKFVLWGTAGDLADAALPPPYTREFFLERLMDWVRAQYPIVVIPLVVVAIVWIAKRAKKDQKPADAYRSMITWWLLPYLASVVFVAAGKVLPYYRFMNSTASIMPLAALGIFVVGVWLMKKTNHNVFVAAVALIVLIGALAVGMQQGLKNSRWTDPNNQWIDQPTRISLAAVQSIAESDPSRPVLFVNNYAREFQAYGWSKTYANVGRAGLTGDVAPRTFQYFGDLPDFLAGTSTITEPDCTELVDKAVETDDLAAVSKKPICTYDLISRGFLEEQEKGVAANGGTPYVFLINKFNTLSANLPYFDAESEEIAALDPSVSLVDLGNDVRLLQGPGMAEASPEQIDGASAAERAVAAELANPPKAWSNPAHSLRVFVGLLLLFVLPGLIAARWFGIKGWQMKLGLIPPVSIALSVIAAIFVIAVTRSPFGMTNAVAAVVVANSAALGLNGLARRRNRSNEVDFEAFLFKKSKVSGLAPGPGEIDSESEQAIAKGFARREKIVANFRRAGFDVRIAADGRAALTLTGRSFRSARRAVLIMLLGEAIDDMSEPFKQYKNFRALMLTQYVSMAADGVVAGTIFASVTNPQNAKSGSDVLALVFLTYLPFAFIAPFVGVLADRYDRGRLLVIINYARAVMIAVAVVMFIAGNETVALLSAMSLLMLAGFRLMLVVKGASLPDSVQGKDLLLGNSLSQAGGTIFQAAGAIFGAGMSKVFKDVNAGYFAIAAIALYASAGSFAKRLGKLETGTPAAGFGSALRGVFRNIVDGVKEVGRRPGAAVGILSFWFTRTLVFGFVALSIVFRTVESLASGGKKSVVAQLIPVGFAAIGAGIGLFSAQWLKDKVAPAKVITVSMLGGGIAAILTPAPLGRVLIAPLFAGLAFFLVKVSADTVTQRALPDDFRGRAYSLFDITYALSYALPAAVLFAADSAGVPLDYVTAAYGAIVVLIALGLGAWSRKIGLYKDVSDDLSEEQLVEGVPD